MVDDQRIARLRVRVVALGQEDVRAQVHRPPPELREALALDPLVLDVLRLGRVGDGRDDLVQRDLDRSALGRVDRDLARACCRGCRAPCSMLAFPAVHGQLDHVAVGAAEGLVTMEQGLDGVGARADVLEALQRVADVGPAHGHRLPRLHPVHVEAEDLLRLEAVVDQEARLLAVVGREHDQQAAVERVPALLGGETDVEAKTGAGGCAGPRRSDARADRTRTAGTVPRGSARFMGGRPPRRRLGENEEGGQASCARRLDARPAEVALYPPATAHRPTPSGLPPRGPARGKGVTKPRVLCFVSSSPASGRGLGPCDMETRHMTQQKKLKRAVRARARKTGESYAAARRQVVQAGRKPAVTAAPTRSGAPAPRGGTKSRPRSGEAGVLKKTGHGYDHWFAVLDAFGAAAKGHTATASAPLQGPRRAGVALADDHRGVRARARAARRRTSRPRAISRSTSRRWSPSRWRRWWMPCAPRAAARNG